MNAIPFETAACLISLIALIYGIVNIIKYKIPMYFCFPVAAVGCYVLEELWVVVNTLFGNYGSFFSVRLFGVFGFFCFLLCVNTGGIDKILDEGGPNNRRARILALIAPITLLALYLLLFGLRIKEFGVFKVLLGYLVYLPVFPSSYFHLKHLLLKDSDENFLKCIRGCDIICLVADFLNLAYLFNYTEDLLVISYISDVVLSLIVFALVAFSIKGGKQWKASL